MAKKKDIPENVLNESSELTGRVYPIGKDNYVIYKERFKNGGHNSYIKLNGEIVFTANKKMSISQFLHGKQNELKSRKK